MSLSLSVNIVSDSVAAKALCYCAVVDKMLKFFLVLVLHAAQICCVRNASANCAAIIIMAVST